MKLEYISNSEKPEKLQATHCFLQVVFSLEH